MGVLLVGVIKNFKGRQKYFQKHKKPSINNIQIFIIYRFKILYRKTNMQGTIQVQTLYIP